MLVKRGRLASGVAALERAGMSTTLPNFVLAVGVWTVGAAAVGVLLAGPVVGLLHGRPSSRSGPGCSSKFRAGRRQAAFADQLDDSLQLMAGSLRAGHSLLRAVDAVSQDAVSPTSEEFARIVNETRVGRDLSDSLDEVAERMGSDDFTWVAQAIAIHREVGGNLAEVLDAVGHTIRERNQIRRQVKALSAEGKLSAIVLGALPFAIIGFISMTNPAYLAKFTAELGRLRDDRRRRRPDDAHGRVLAQEDGGDQVLMTMTIPFPVLAAAVAVVSALPLIGWAVFARPAASTVQARDNLTRGIAAVRRPDRGRPGPGLGARLVTGLTPAGTVARLDRLASRAGRPADWPVPKLVAAKLVLTAVAAASACW